MTVVFELLGALELILLLNATILGKKRRGKGGGTDIKENLVKKNGGG